MRFRTLVLLTASSPFTFACGEEPAPSLDSRATFVDEPPEDEEEVSSMGGSPALRIPTDPHAVIASSGSQIENRFAWPLEGRMNVDWVVHNYVDLDPTKDSIRDYAGSRGDEAKTYDGHLGVDIDIATFREMDEGVVVFAAASGEVTHVQDGRFDRNLSISPSCFGNSNAIYIRHADGSEARYLHFRAGSLQVTEGQFVDVGTPLGLVGSSGCSTAPHLHFEVRNAEGEIVDPFRDGLFEAAPAYSTEMGIMGHYLSDGAFGDLDQVYESLEEPRGLSVGTEMGIALVVGGGRVGDELNVFLARPDGSRFGELVREWEEEHRWSAWWWNRTPDDPGTWHATVSINHVERYEFEFDVGN